MKIIFGLILIGLALSLAGDLLEFVCELFHGAALYFAIKREEAKERRRGGSG